MSTETRAQLAFAQHFQASTGIFSQCSALPRGAYACDAMKAYSRLPPEATVPQPGAQGNSKRARANMHSRRIELKDLSATGESPVVLASRPPVWSLRAVSYTHLTLPTIYSV